jgi:alkyl hydroperoxide reductase subunit AhpC
MESSGSTGLTYTPKVSVRRAAPEFKGKVWHNDAFKEISLSSYKGKWVVLFFYPLDFTFVCPTEICNFSDAAEQFNKLDTEIIGVSGDSAFSHREWALKPRKEGGLSPCNLPLLSDYDHSISKDYGAYIDFGEDSGLSFRATYIIDPKGILRHYQINDLPVGRNVDEILRLVQAFQFTDKHGEVCPARWKPGKATMVTDPNSDKTKQYFAEEMTKDLSKEH